MLEICIVQYLICLYVYDILYRLKSCKLQTLRRDKNLNFAFDSIIMQITSYNSKITTTSINYKNNVIIVIIIM